MKKKKEGAFPGPSPKLNSAYLRMDRARGLRAGTSLRQSRSLGSNFIVMFQHLLDQQNASKIRKP